MALSRINRESSLALSHLMGGPNTVCIGDASRACVAPGPVVPVRWFLAILIPSAL